MTDVLVHAISQWGTAGIVALAAGWVLWDSWKKNKENEKWMREQVQNSSNARALTRNDLSEISTSIKDMRREHIEFRDEVRARVAAVEDKITQHHPDHGSMEAARLNAISQIAPSIHTIINEGLDMCSCDHIAVALLHNGTVTLSGIPYIKFGIVAEKYKPVRYPQDFDLLSKYKEEDILSHNRLPSCIVQNPNIEFRISDDSALAEIDPGLFIKCKNHGIKRIGFEAIRDIHGLTTGFVLIYKFDSSPLDIDGLHSVTTTIEHLYQNMLASFG